MNRGPDKSSPITHVIQLNTVIVQHADGPHLLATWMWPGGLLSDLEVQELADAWTTALGLLATYGQDGLYRHTPSDLTLRTLDQDEIDELEEQWDE